MDAKKRSAPADDAGPRPKRQAVDTSAATTPSKCGTPTALTLDALLPEFQKDAMFRQMKEYKRTATLLQTKVDSLEVATAQRTEHVRLVDGWVNQLLEEIVASAPPDAPTDVLESSVFCRSELRLSDDSAFQKYLSERADLVTKALASLVPAIHAPPDIQTVQEKLSRALAREKSLQAELAAAMDERDALTADRDEQKESRVRAERTIDRIQSDIVKQVDNIPISLSTPVPNGDSSADQAAEPVTAAQTATSKESEAVISKLRSQLSELEVANERLEADVSRHLTRLATLTDDDYSHTDLYKAIQSRYALLVTQLDDITAKNTENIDRVRTLEKERTAFRVQLDRDSRAQITELEGRLTKAESDLIRVRQARDDLHSQVISQKAIVDEFEASRTASDSRLTETTSRIEALELELKRVHQANEGGDVADRPDLAELSEDKIRQRVQELEAQNVLLNSELTAMATAYQRASALASEKMASQRRVDQFVSQKAKSDERLFSSMKRLETLETENRNLRSIQNSNSDYITKLKTSETQWKSMITTLEAQVGTLKEANSAVSTQYKTAQQQFADAAVSIDNLHTQVAELKKLVSTKDTDLSAAVRTQRAATVDVEALTVRLSELRKTAEALRKKSRSSQSQEELMLRHIAYCSLCKRNLKDTVLKSCGHVFCHGCVEERITSRSRKCPYCMMSFGLNDYRNIILDP